MLADKLFIPEITVSGIVQDFDFVHETEHTLRYMQVKMPNLDDYDHNNFDEADSFILTNLDRWGDRRLAAASSLD